MADRLASERNASSVDAAGTGLLANGECDACDAAWVISHPWWGGANRGLAALGGRAPVVVSGVAFPATGDPARASAVERSVTEYRVWTA